MSDLHREPSLQSNRQVFFNLSPPIMNYSDDDLPSKHKKRWKFRVPWNKKKEYSDESSEEEKPEFYRSEFDVSHTGRASQKTVRPHTWYGRSDDESVSISDTHGDEGRDSDSVSVSSLSSVASNSKKPKKFKLKMPSLSPRESSVNVKKSDRFHDKIVEGKHSYLRNDSIRLTEGYASDDSSLYTRRKKYQSSDEDLPGPRRKTEVPEPKSLDSKHSSSIQDFHKVKSSPIFTRSSTIANLAEGNSDKDFADSRSSVHSRKSTKSSASKKMEGAKSESNLHGNVVAIRNPQANQKKAKATEKKPGKFLTFFKQITYQHSTSESDYSSSSDDESTGLSSKAKEKNDKVIQELKDNSFRRRSRSLNELNSKKKTRTNSEGQTTDQKKEETPSKSIVLDEPEVGEWQHRKTNSLPGRSKKKKKKREAMAQHIVVAQHHETPKQVSKVAQPSPKESKIEYPVKAPSTHMEASPPTLPDVPKTDPGQEGTETKRRKKKKKKTKPERSESEVKRIRRPSYESMVDLLEKEEFDPTSDTTLVSTHSEKNSKIEKSADFAKPPLPSTPSGNQHLKSVESWQRDIQRSLQDLGEDNPPKVRDSVSSSTDSVPDIGLHIRDISNSKSRMESPSNSKYSPTSPLYSDALDLGFLKKRQQMTSETLEQCPADIIRDKHRNSLLYIGDEPPPNFPPPPPPLENSDEHSSCNGDKMDLPVPHNESFANESLYENCRRFSQKGSSSVEEGGRNDLYLPPKSRRILTSLSSTPPPVPSLPKLDDEPWSISSSFAYDSSVPPSPFLSQRSVLNESICTCSGYPTVSESPSVRSSMRSAQSYNLSKRSTIESIPSDYIDEALNLLDEKIPTEMISDSKRTGNKYKSRLYFDRLSKSSPKTVKSNPYQPESPKVPVSSSAGIPKLTNLRRYEDLTSTPESNEEYTQQIRKSFEQFADRYLPTSKSKTTTKSETNNGPMQSESTYDVYKKQFSGGYSKPYKNSSENSQIVSPQLGSSSPQNLVQNTSGNGDKERLRSVARFSNIPLYNSVYGTNGTNMNSSVAAKTNLWEQKAYSGNLTKNTRIGEFPYSKSSVQDYGNSSQPVTGGTHFYRAEKIIIGGKDEPVEGEKKPVETTMNAGQTRYSPSSRNTLEKEQIRNSNASLLSTKSEMPGNSQANVLKRIKTTTEDGSIVTTRTIPIGLPKEKSPPKPSDYFTKEEYNRMAAVPKAMDKMHGEKRPYERGTTKSHTSDSLRGKDRVNANVSPLEKDAGSPSSISSHRSFSLDTLYSTKDERKIYPDVQLNINHTYFNPPEDHETETRIYRTSIEKEMHTDVHTTIMIPGEKEIITVTTSPKGGHPLVRKKQSLDLDDASHHQIDLSSDSLGKAKTVFHLPPPVPKKPPPKRPLSGDQIDFMTELLDQKSASSLPPRPPPNFSNLSPRKFTPASSSLARS